MPLAIDINGNMTLPRGDTGAVTFGVRRSDGEVFTEYDRALFTIKDASDRIVLQRQYSIDTGEFTVEFANQDTDNWPVGTYSYDTRYVITPSYDDDGNIVDGDQVITPSRPRSFTIITTVGRI